MTRSEIRIIRATLEIARSVNFKALISVLQAMKDSSYNTSGGRRYFENIKDYIDNSISNLDSALSCLNDIDNDDIEPDDDKNDMDF